MSRELILQEIDRERDYQDGKWGHRLDDEVNTPWMWVSYIASYATKWMNGSFAPLGSSNVDDFRTKMVKTAVIAVAAIESVDRQRAQNTRAFYEAE